MTDPTSVLRREVDALIQNRITILNQAKPLTELGLAEFRAPSETIAGGKYESKNNLN
jgi:hypothetical protein